MALTFDPDSLIAIQPWRFAELEILDLVTGVWIPWAIQCLAFTYGQGDTVFQHSVCWLLGPLYSLPIRWLPSGRVDSVESAVSSFMLKAVRNVGAIFYPMGCKGPQCYHGQLLVLTFETAFILNEQTYNIHRPSTPPCTYVHRLHALKAVWRFSKFWCGEGKKSVIFCTFLFKISAKIGFFPRKHINFRDDLFYVAYKTWRL